MKTYVLQRSQCVCRPLDDVFAFFADAANLERLTPHWLRFSIRTPQPIEMRVGAKIDYRIWWRGLPMRWRTEIAEWVPGERFVDMQLRGPYKLWHHTHTFRAIDARTTLVEDEVRYAMPLGWLGQVAYAINVRRDVERIFDYRRAQIRALFGECDFAAGAVAYTG